MHWQIHKDSRNHYQVAQRRGERLPVAIAFGCPPAVTYASTAPLPGDIDEYLFAGFVQGKRVEMVDCKTVPLQVPAARRGGARRVAGARRRRCRRGRSATTPASTPRRSRSRR